MLEEWHDIWRHALHLGVAYVLALPVGWNREHCERSAGLRTFPLVAIAACSFVLVSQHMMQSAEGQANILAGLITGIGFIGGGAIVKGENGARGTATAASLWATGAMGGAVGYGLYDVAVTISAATLATLWFKREEPGSAKDG